MKKYRSIKKKFVESLLVLSAAACPAIVSSSNNSLGHLKIDNNVTSPFEFMVPA